MDKNKFWLGGRLFNTASPRLGAPTQRKARPQDGRPNATQGTSARWVPQRNTRHVCKLGTPTHVRNANTRPVHTSASWAPERNVEQGTSARWAPKSNTRHVRKLGAPTQRKARPQVGRPNARPQHKRKARPHVRNTNARHVRTSASWVPQHNERYVRKMVAQTKNSSATKTSTQGSTRLKDELEDG
jgi:hypothetical protein